MDTWSRIAQSCQQDATRKQHAVTWRDHRTGLEIRYVVIDWTDFPVIEWTVYFKNKEEGFDVKFLTRPGGAVITYKKVG
jgi:hypothetical protein